MKTVIIEYAVISPAVLAYIVEHTFKGCECYWEDIDEDYFEFSVFSCDNLAELEDVLAEFM